MVITIGKKTSSSFQEPLALLSDCHRRIERFLEALIQAAEASSEGVLLEAHREPLEAALRYFREAAPRHTRDEEDSLFPRMRASAVPDVRAALPVLEALEQDHVAADAGHRRVDALGLEWLAQGRLPPETVEEMRTLLYRLRDTYAEHIGLEDRELFPLAGRALEPDALRAMGREMAARRGIDPNTPLLGL